MKQMSEYYGELVISGKKIAVKHTELEQEKLLFYPENPRIFSLLRLNSESEPSQQDIQEQLEEMEHVNSLVQSIKANGGLIDPVIVRDNDFVVFEGNSRLAAYRKLARKDPIKWGKIRCQILPHDIDEKDIFMLLGQYHIISRKDWAPFEQAGYLYRRHKKHEISALNMAKEMGLSEQRVKQLIDIYSFMIDNKICDSQKWSYFDEYFKSNHIKKARGLHIGLDNAVVEKIKSGEIANAIDIRQKLVPVLKIKGNKKEKIIEKFVEGSYTIDDAFEKAELAGATSTLIERLSKFKDFTAEKDIIDEITSMNNEQKNKCIYEIKKIKSNIDDLAKKLGM